VFHSFTVSQELCNCEDFQCNLLILLNREGFTVSQPEKTGISVFFEHFLRVAKRWKPLLERRFRILARERVKKKTH
jgi:hypothetical protein